MKCKCGSYAINPHLHGRDGSRNDLCDVCYWRNKAENLTKLNQDLRVVFQQILEALGSGSCSIDSSIEFIQSIPNEVKLVIEKLKNHEQKETKDIQSIEASFENPGSFKIEWEDEDHLKITKYWGTYSDEIIITGGDFESLLNVLLAQPKITRNYDWPLFEAENR